MSKLIVLYKYICKGLKKIKSHIKCDYQLGYWDKLYDKYYEEYKFLSIKELRRLQSIKSVDYNVNMSYTWVNIFMGAIFLLFVDTLARSISVSEVPLGVLTGFIGTVFFVWVLWRNKKVA